MNGDFSWNRILFNSRAYARRLFLTGDGTYRQIAENQDRRVVLLVSAWPKDTAAADCWVKADDKSLSDTDSTNYGVNILHQAAGPSSLTGATLVPAANGSFKLDTLGFVTTGGTDNQSPTSLTVAGTIDPVTGAVAETIVATGLSNLALRSVRDDTTAFPLTLPTYNVTLGGSGATVVVNQKDFRLALDKDGPSVRLPWFAAATGSGAWLHIVECHCSLADIEQFAHNPY